MVKEKYLVKIFILNFICIIFIYKFCLYYKLINRYSIENNIFL